MIPLFLTENQQVEHSQAFDYHLSPHCDTGPFAQRQYPEHHVNLHRVGQISIHSHWNRFKGVLFQSCVAFSIKIYVEFPFTTLLAAHMQALELESKPSCEILQLDVNQGPMVTFYFLIPICSTCLSQPRTCEPRISRFHPQSRDADCQRPRAYIWHPQCVRQNQKRFISDGRKPARPQAHGGSVSTAS